jgi:hypothetical protein
VSGPKKKHWKDSERRELVFYAFLPAILLKKKEMSVAPRLFGQIQGQEPLVMNTTLVAMLLKPGPWAKRKHPRSPIGPLKDPGLGNGQQALASLGGRAQRRSDPETSLAAWSGWLIPAWKSTCGGAGERGGQREPGAFGGPCCAWSQCGRRREQGAQRDGE